MKPLGQDPEHVHVTDPHDILSTYTSADTAR